MSSRDDARSTPGRIYLTVGASVGGPREVDTAAIRYVHSTTPVIEWLMPDRLEKSAFVFHPLKGGVPGKREHDQ